MKVWSLSMSKSKYPVYMHFIFFFSGIDLAFIENGFIYHTKYDTADRILTDSIQRAGTQTSYTLLLFIIYYLLFNTHCKYIQCIFAGGCVCLSRRKRSLQQWTGVVRNSCRHHFSVTDTNACCPFVLYPPVPVWSALC